jgi:hypothetical protein
MQAVLTKEDVEKSLVSLPTNFSLDDLMEKLIITEKINIAKIQIENGEFIEDEDLDSIVEKW